MEIKRKNNLFSDQEIPFFEVVDKELSIKDIVISGIFLERYLNKESFDTIKRVSMNNSNVYKEKQDYFFNYNLELYKDYGIEIKDNITRKYDIMFTEDGFNKYVSRFSKSNQETYKEQINNIIYFFGIYKSKESITSFKPKEIDSTEEIEDSKETNVIDTQYVDELDFFDILDKETYDLDRILEIINSFVDCNFGYKELCEIINGEFEIKCRIDDKEINNTVIPELVRYTGKDELVYILLSLIDVYCFDRLTLIKIVQNIIIDFYK